MLISYDRIVEKGWGKEIWLFNKDYCGKILIFNKDKKLSFHYHKNKEEYFYLESGKLKILYGKSKEISKAIELIMNPGDLFFCKRGLKHQIIALEDSRLFEFSTHHKDSDSYRIIKGD